MKSSKLLLMFPSWALGWDSSIVYHDSNNRLVYVSDGEGNRIVDFSHAGYKGGTFDLPQMDVKVTISHVSGDNTANIQDAIDTVAALTPNASGHRGAVLLQKGTYRVSGVIYIHTSGVVLRGEGQDNTGTVIVGTGTDQMIGLGVVVVKSSILSEPIEPSTTQQITSEIVPVGSRTFEVENGSMYSIGDRLIIQHPATDAWLAAIRYGDTAGDSVPWVPFQGDLTMKFEGMVTAIVGNKVKLDSPIYSELRRSLSQATVSRHSGIGVLSECGIENIRVVSKNEASADPQNESHRSDCVHFINVRDCWAVSVTATGFVQSGIQITNSIRSTVLDFSALDPVSKVEGGRRYNFQVENNSHDILFKGCRSSKGRRDFVSNGTARTSGIVFTQCSASGSYTSSENHRRWGSGILWDKISFADPNINLSMTLGLGYNRGSAGTSHGWTGSGMVGWNVSGKKIVVQKPPLGQNYALGCKGIVDNTGPYVFPLGMVEGTGRIPSIASLYEAQLAERMTYGVGPDTPATLKVTTGAVLSWTDIALDETSYVIERSSRGGATYSILATLDANSISYIDSTAKVGVSYTYRVKAINVVGSSAYGSPISIIITTISSKPTTRRPTTRNPTTYMPTTRRPTTAKPSTTNKPTSSRPSNKPSTYKPTSKPTSRRPTNKPTSSRPSNKPSTSKPTSGRPTTRKPTSLTVRPTSAKPTTSKPSSSRATVTPTVKVTLISLTSPSDKSPMNSSALPSNTLSPSTSPTDPSPSLIPSALPSDSDDPSMIPSALPSNITATSDPGIFV